MRTKGKLTISIDENVLNESKRILDDLGLKRAFYLETVLRALVESERKSMKQVYGEVYGPLFEKITRHHKQIKKEKKK